MLNWSVVVKVALSHHRSTFGPSAGKTNFRKRLKGRAAEMWGAQNRTIAPSAWEEPAEVVSPPGRVTGEVFQAGPCGPSVPLLRPLPSEPSDLSLGQMVPTQFEEHPCNVSSHSLMAKKLWWGPGQLDKYVVLPSMLEYCWKYQLEEHIIPPQSRSEQGFLGLLLPPQGSSVIVVYHRGRLFSMNQRQSPPS